MTKIKVCCISDTHSKHNYLQMPEADILIFAGDISGYGDWQDLLRFNAWLAKIKDKYKAIFGTWGNHELQAEKDIYHAESIVSNATILVDKTIEYNGLVIHGTPYTIEFFDWAFNKKTSDMEEVWKKVPDNVNILISHQPPYGILDEVTDLKYNPEKNVGCKYLKQEIENRFKDLKLSVFGHLHMLGGQQRTINNTTFVNAAMLDDNYNPGRKPVVVEIEI